jgi:putative transposase
LNALHATIATEVRTMAVKRISRAGHCYDNAMTESLWATLKKEIAYRQYGRTHYEARAGISQWIHVSY